MCENIISTDLFFIQHNYNGTMSRTISRSSAMSKTIVFRAHEEDIANIKLAAQKKGKDCSAFIRDLLIREGIIKPV